VTCEAMNVSKACFNFVVACGIHIRSTFMRKNYMIFTQIIEVTVRSWRFIIRLGVTISNDPWIIQCISTWNSFRRFDGQHSLYEVLGIVRYPFPVDGYFRMGQRQA
jgi:hypothetical protein